MTSRKFNLYNRLCALVVFVASAVTYLLTIEPSASFWDCGEFITSSYKLEVGHPPGNPAYQLFARFATIFGDNMHAAILVNSLSALCSALTILLLYLTIVWFCKRLLAPAGSTNAPVSQSTTAAAVAANASAPAATVAASTTAAPCPFAPGRAIAILGSGVVGALVYAFSDTFWFSAVEAEVYAMSSLFTAFVFWAMTKWYDTADEPHADKWIVLIALAMGISIGVHLLNLLMIPTLVFMYYYRKKGDKKVGFWGGTKIFAIGVVLLAVILYGIVPLLPKIAGYADLLFVNVFGLPFNSGAVFFMLALLGLCFWGIYATLKKGKVFLNTTLLCFTSIVIGFSIFSIVVIRSNAKTPTNEYQPDNAFTLVRYLSREQYGSQPLIYGQYFDAPYDIKTDTYWAPLGDKYVKAESPIDAEYLPEGKMLFPRMWATSNDGRYEEFYSLYMPEGSGKRVPGATYRKPSQASNLRFFFDYQLGWMYWRYFMWNFVGRQNQIHAPTPDNIFHGNWESGIKFIDNLRLGDQSDAPAVLKEDKGKNHYFFLPLLLGLLGLFAQFDRDKRGCWLNFLMFFMTGIAIVLYLNQQPYQVRERDYAYAGSFYFFSVWVGLGVAAVVALLDRLIKRRGSAVTGLAASVACLFVPVLMAAQNWDDHDRSNRRTAVEMAANYLNAVGGGGILITHGDNDTFPLWYAQEVEDVRTDVRIVNTSLLGTDWHIDQMKWAVNESAPLPLSVGQDQYLYGTNEWIPVLELTEETVPLKDVMTIFKHPKIKAPMSSGREVDYIAARKMSIPVNKENVIKYGILDEKYAEQIPDSIVLTIPAGKDYLTKQELFMLDLLSSYEWDRPISILAAGGDLKMGIKDYLEYQGFAYKFVPIKSTTTLSTPGFVDPDELYRLMTEVYRWDEVSSDDYFIDYQNYYTFLGVLSLRSIFANCADVFMRNGQNDRALEMLDTCERVMACYPLSAIPVGFTGNDLMVIDMVKFYYELGEADKARELASRLSDELLQSAAFYAGFYEWGRSEFEASGSCLYSLAEEMKAAGDGELAEGLIDELMALLKN